MAKLIKANFAEVKRLERKLRRLTEAKGGKSLRHITSSAMNTTAFRARRDLMDNVLPDAFVLRNKWTARGIRVQKTKASSVGRQGARVGVLKPREGGEHYLVKQHTGGNLGPTSEHGRRVPTAASSGEGRGARPRRRDMRRVHRPGNLKFARKFKVSGLSEKQKAIVAVKLARKQNAKHAWLSLRGGAVEGVFDVRSHKIKMVHRYYRKTLRVKRTQWMDRLRVYVADYIEQDAKRAIEDQVTRFRLLGTTWTRRG